MYRPATGCRKALRTVVDSRSYSRNSGCTSQESDTSMSGSAARSASPMRCSCRGLRNENRKQTATLSAPLACTSAMARADVGVPERQDDLARRTDALGHLEAVLARHQRLGMIGLQVVDLGPGLAADLEQVLEALGGDERDLAAAPLDQRVGRDRRAVGEKREAASGRKRAQPFQDRARGIVGRGGDLVRARLAGRVVHQEEVGEGAADVHSQRRAHPLPMTRLGSQRATPGSAMRSTISATMPITNGSAPRMTSAMGPRSRRLCTT